VKKYQVIYADPPWPHKSGTLHKIIPYPILRLNQIEELPVRTLKTSTSVLLLWTTDKYLPHALKVMYCWGFKYSTIAFVWVKLTPLGGSVSWMVGGWTLKATEICLLGTSGKVSSRLLKYKPKQLVVARRGIHSQKPSIVRKRIERMFPNTSKIELFARKKSSGWDVWGNEVESDIVL